MSEKFGPPTIGETVETIANNVKFRGVLTVFQGVFAYIAVLGYPETLQVDRSQVVPIRG